MHNFLGSPSVPARTAVSLCGVWVFFPSQYPYLLKTPLRVARSCSGGVVGRISSDSSHCWGAPSPCCCCLVTVSRLTLLPRCGLEPTRLLCPWDFSGKRTGVGCISFFRGSSRPRDQTFISSSPALASGFFYH